MKLDKKDEQKFLIDETGGTLYIDHLLNLDGVLIQKYRYQKIYLLYERIRISLNSIEDHFEQVDNFKDLYYSVSKKKMCSYIFLYKSKQYDFYLAIAREDIGDDFDNPEEYEAGEGYRKITSLYYKSESDLDEISKHLEEIFECDYESSSKVNIVLKTNGGFTLKEIPTIPMPIDIETMYNDDFKDVYDHLCDTLINGGKGIVLLHGLAGTGKSNLIRHLTCVAPKKRFVFIPNNMIHALADPSFLSTLVDNKNLVLILEDCENFIRDRKTSGDSSMVGTILNLTDGILSDFLKLQIICTFNNDLTEVDPALLRKGRLIDEYEFKALEKNKAEVLMKQLDIDPSLVSEYTLANIFNAKDKGSRKKTVKKQIGFGR